MRRCYMALLMHRNVAVAKGIVFAVRFDGRPMAQGVVQIVILIICKHYGTISEGWSSTLSLLGRC